MTRARAEDPALDLEGDDGTAEAIDLIVPDFTAAEAQVLSRVLLSGPLSDGRMTEAFETAFAAYVGRAHAVAVSSGSMAMLLLLKAYGLGEGDDVVCSPYGWHQVQHAVALAGANAVFCDIDYWQHTLNPEKAAQRITPATKAIIAANVNGHPAHWDELRALATEKGLILIEDSTEAIGSRYKGKIVGSFGDAAVFDFSEPGVLLTGEGGMIVTDDRELAHKLRYLRRREVEHRNTVVITRTVPYGVAMNNLAAALGMVQLQRLPEILAKRKQVVAWYDAAMQSFEGVKPPYKGPGAEEVYPLLYVVHLGTRFSASGRKSVIEDLDMHAVESSDYGQPLYTQQYYQERGANRADCPVCQKTADRALALPLHHKITEEEIGFVVDTLKDATVNTGAGAAIYL
jgi:perosamine synthetase